MTRRKAPTPKKAPATAPGQALGYSLQFTRLTALLLESAEGSSCSLEVLDDVAAQDSSGNTKLSQSKSALTDNPVADRASSLWKTLFNWLQLVKEHHVDPAKTIFEIYVSRQVEGELITAFDQAITLDDSKAAIAKARNLLWGVSPGYPQKLQLAEGIKAYVNTFLEADDAAVLPLIMGLRLKCGTGSPQVDIERIIGQAPVSKTRVFDIANQICGWVKREADKHLERGIPAIIRRDDFHREYVSYVRRIDRDIILKSWAVKPSETEMKERLFDTFVRQLDLIGLTFDDQLAAISDYLRSSSDRTLWSEVGDVHEASFSELDEVLKRTWANHNRAVGIEAASKTEIERGQLLHSRCMIFQAKVQGMEPPAHFIPGCFHGLADDKAIGWHPGFRDLLKSSDS